VHTNEVKVRTWADFFLHIVPTIVVNVVVNAVGNGAEKRSQNAGEILRLVLVYCR